MDAWQAARRRVGRFRNLLTHANVPRFDTRIAPATQAQERTSMRFDVTPEEVKRSNIPHEIFLTNLIGNHILMFVASLGVLSSLPWLIALVPIISFGLMGYTLWRARRSLKREPWYVMCHWQVAARRTKLFMLMLSLLLVISLAGWLGYTYGGMMREAVWALIGGVGILPVMVTMLILILMESEALYHSNLHRLPNWVVERHPNPDVRLIAENTLTQAG
jgi:hypothetical protein